MNKFYLFALLSLIACYQQEQNCNDYKTGVFEMREVIDDKEEISVFNRTETLQIETFKGVTDTSTVRWINDCEMILFKVNPKYRADKKGVHIKILRTDDKGYFFEYNFVGENNKASGYAKKIG